MGKRKKAGKRRRVGAAGMSKKTMRTVIALAGAGIGFIAGNAINGAIDKVLPKNKETGLPIQGIGIAAQLGGGGLMLALMKHPVGVGVGGVLAGSGIRRVLKSTGIMAGYQAVPVIGRKHLAGYQAVPVIGGNSTPPQLAGTPAQLQGFRVNGYVPTGSGMGVMGTFVNPTGSGHMG